MNRLNPSIENIESIFPTITIAITTGEPAGIGPEIVLSALSCASTRWPKVQFVVLGNYPLLNSRAAIAGISIEDLQLFEKVKFVHFPLPVPCKPGKLDQANALYVVDLLDYAIQGAIAGDFNAIVTAPLQKSNINDIGVKFTGHTEYLAYKTGVRRVVMMFTSVGTRPLRIALATTHLPLSKVSSALSQTMLVDLLNIISTSLRFSFGLTNPIIFVTGLNPHAGENGHLGKEEILIINPALEKARSIGIDARGPYPADTLFQPRFLNTADCILAMFHDQGLPVFKCINFKKGVNVTLGLPFVRTSVDHGTALDIAGTGHADSGSMIAALDIAVSMALCLYTTG